MDLDKQTGAIRFCDIGPEWPRWQEFLGAPGREIPQKLLPAASAFKFVGGSKAPARLNFIWHSSYCCSTAIATALDVRGRNFSVFEPQIMISLAHARRQADRERKGDISWLSDAIFRLIARPFTPGAAVTVKPASTSNYLAMDAAAKTNGKMLFLYSDCRSFLVASMRYGEHRRQFVRSLFRDIRRESDAAQRWTSDAAADLTDLEVAGLVWQWQIARFRECLKRFGDRAASLDCDAFLAKPQETIARLWEFFELPGDAHESPVFADAEFLRRHVKFSAENFSAEERLGAEKTLDPKVLDEIERVVEASASVFPENRGALPLARALLTVQKAYPR
jgi:hypothetical protein